jgi:hypothetical protein
VIIECGLGLRRIRKRHAKTKKGPGGGRRYTVPRSQLSLFKLKLFDIKTASFIYNSDNLGFGFYIFKVCSISENLDSCINWSDFPFDASLIKIDIRKTIKFFLLTFLC